MQKDFLKSIKYFRCGKKGHVTKSCHCVVNQVGVEQVNKGQHLRGQQVDSKQVDSTQVDNKQHADSSKSLTDISQALSQINSEQENQMMGLMTRADTQAWIHVLTVSTCAAAKSCHTDVIGSVYKVDITIYGVPTRALIDSGSQACIARQQL